MKTANKTILVLSLAMVMIGCTNISDGVDRITPTINFTATRMMTPTITQADIPVSPSPTISPTPVFTESPTPNPTATLSVSEAEQIVFDLFANNGDCEIPCIWGITPGGTDKASVAQLLNKLSPITGLTSSDQLGGAAFFHTFSDGFDLTLGYDLHEDVVQSIQIFTHMREANNGVIEDEYAYNDSEYQEIMKDFLINNILSKYGTPSTVLFRSFGLGPEDFPSETVLFYFDFGLSIQYTSPNSYIDDTISTCPWEAHIAIQTWDPNTEGPDLADFKTPPLNFRELGSVTNMNAQSFYETFSIPTDSCIETQTDIWPLFPGQQSP